MDLLKDITRELRGDDESARDDGSAGRASRPDAVDSSTTDAAAERSAGDDSPSDATNDNSPSDESPDRGSSKGNSPNEDRSNEGSPNGGRARDPPGSDVHVCSFCETEFDADRGACPECDAELVLRGER